MQVRFDLPPVIDSPPARLDARWRLALLLIAIVTVAVVRSLGGSLICLASAMLLAALARMDWRWFGARFAILAVLLTLFVVPVPFLADDGLRFAALLAAKAVALFTLTAILLVTAPVDATLKAAHELWIPGLLIHLTLLSYRYLFLLGDELARLRIALRVRGFRNRANLHAYRAVAAASGTLLVRSHERAERVEAAMRCRGFDGQFRSLTDFRTRGTDVFAVALALVWAIGIIVADVFLWS